MPPKISSVLPQTPPWQSGLLYQHQHFASNVWDSAFVITLTVGHFNFVFKVHLLHVACLMWVLRLKVFRLEFFFSPLAEFGDGAVSGNIKKKTYEFHLIKPPESVDMQTLFHQLKQKLSSLLKSILSVFALGPVSAPHLCVLNTGPSLTGYLWCHTSCS